MHLPDGVKHLPRWTWFTIGGLGIGYGAIHMWKNRATDAAPATASTDASAPGTDPGSPPPGGTGYTGVVVPPTIIAAPASDTGGLTDLISGFDTLINGFGALYNPVQAAMLGAYQSNSDTIQQLALAGGAPQSVPSPVMSAPAPAPSVVPAAKTAAKCPPQYPFTSARGCYQVACKNKQRVHAYAGNVPDQYTGEKC